MDVKVSNQTNNSPQESGVNTLTSSQICGGYFNKGDGMSLKNYDEACVIGNESYQFRSLIMAAFLEANRDEHIELKKAFPGILQEMLDRNKTVDHRLLNE